MENYFISSAANLRGSQDKFQSSINDNNSEIGHLTKLSFPHYHQSILKMAV